LRRFGLIGYPLDHSFSQKYFTQKFGEEGLDCQYELFPIQSISDLSDLLSKHPDLEGLNVTIPYKQLVLRQLNSAIHIPEGVRACNCIQITEGKLIGYNTDIIGFEKSLVPLLQPIHKKALVLGNGGATAAVMYVLDKLGITSQIVSRKIHDGSTLTYADLDQELINDHLLIINTTPVGMHPHIEQSLPFPDHYITSQHLCYLFIIRKKQPS
jgi:shikimate dehydrogenase